MKRYCYCENPIIESNKVNAFCKKCGLLIEDKDKETFNEDAKMIDRMECECDKRGYGHSRYCPPQPLKTESWEKEIEQFRHKIFNGDFEYLKSFISNLLHSQMSALEKEVEKINVDGGGSGRRLKIEVLSLINKHKNE